MRTKHDPNSSGISAGGTQAYPDVSNVIASIVTAASASARDFGSGHSPRHAPPPNAQMLALNLDALSRRSPAAAQAIGAAQGSPQIEFWMSADGLLGGTDHRSGQNRQLASRHAARAEADILIDTLDLLNDPVIAVHGFGLGHHLIALSCKIKSLGAIIVFDPDVALLREVFSRTDFRAVIATSHLVLITDGRDAASLSAGVQGLEGMMACGTALLEHTPSRGRLRAFDSTAAFAPTLETIIKSVRTNIVTTLVQADITVRNSIQNIGFYAQRRGIAPLANLAKGFPAVIVSAGPSLAKNLHLLAQPGIRDRVVIIAVQTTLKMLLARGIRPHFVTALDYHEISGRFYEGLTAADVEGVTLICEPKCNPIIPYSFPGHIRCVGEEVCDQILGESLYRDLGKMRRGATVAHLAYYLAQHLGCDPVIFIGQDLAFTDGHYYGPNAAIHNTWAGEVSDFRTLEVLEWERIARMKRMLRRVSDHDGNSIYTDEQMATYHVQFERDFVLDSARGITIIDATEGGIAKRGTTIMPLAQALERFADRQHDLERHLAPFIPRNSLNALDPVSPAARATSDAPTTAQLIARLQQLRDDAQRIAALANRSHDILDRALTFLNQPHRLNALIGHLQEMASQAASKSAYWLVQFTNQLGQLKRFRADRQIALANLSPEECQQRQIERDKENVRWLADTALHLANQLDDGIMALRGGPPVYRDQLTPTPQLPGLKGSAHDATDVLADPLAATGSISVTGRATTRTALCIPMISTMEALCPDHVRAHERDTDRAALLKRLAPLTDDLLLLAPEPAAAQALLAQAGITRAKVIPVPRERLIARARAAGIARAWSAHAWRGGIGALSCFDEAFHPALLAPALVEHGVDAAIILSPDWHFTDNGLVNALISRYRERPESHPITFTQAAPGLAPCLLARHVVEECAANTGPFATIGTLLGYIPIAPQADPISKPICIGIPLQLRDRMLRCIPDSPARSRLFAQHNPAAGDFNPAVAASLPPSLINFCAHERIDFTHAASSLGLLASSHTAQGEPWFATLDVPWQDADHLARLVREAGAAAIHIRTRLWGTHEECDALMANEHDVISIDLFANTPEMYQFITGRGDHPAVLDAVNRLIAATPQDDSGGLPSRWIVPRIMRSHHSFAQIEGFFDHAIMNTASCLIDPPDSLPPWAYRLPSANPRPERFRPLPLPAAALAAQQARTLTISLDFQS